MIDVVAMISDGWVEEDSPPETDPVGLISAGWLVEEAAVVVQPEEPAANDVSFGGRGGWGVYLEERNKPGSPFPQHGDPLRPPSRPVELAERIGNAIVQADARQAVKAETAVEDTAMELGLEFSGETDEAARVAAYLARLFSPKKR